MYVNKPGRTLRRALPLLLAATCSTDAEEASLDYRVKASYLLNLLRFIQWPDDTVGAGDSLNLCIYGADTLDAYYALHGERAGNRVISVDRIGDINTVRVNDCHILVMSGDKAVLSIPVVRGLLTVGETEDFGVRGGIVNLLLIGGRIRFEFNEQIARACGFATDPRLSKLRMPSSYFAQVA